MSTPPASADSTDGFEGHRLGSPEYRRITIALFLAGLATFALLYTTQPLLPMLADHFDVSPAHSAWTVSASTLGLGLALLIAGPASEVLGRTPLMHASLFASAVVALACGFVDSWPLLLALRGLEGVVLAGLPAVAMAYLSEEVHSEATSRVAGLYIGGTALGGMTGRLLTGALAEVWGWRAALIGMGVLGVACAIAVALLLPRSRRFCPAPASLSHVVRSTRAILTDPALVCLFGIAGTAMGAFVGVFNAVGFRLESAPYSLSVGVAGLIFLTYSLGSLSSTMAGRAAGRWGQRAVTPVASLVMLAGVLLSLAQPLAVVVLALAVMTSGFFAVHGVASGWVASRAALGPGATGQASSLYLFVYYLGSSVFGALAGEAWSRGGWPVVVAVCGGLVGITLVLALVLRHIPSLAEPHRRDRDVVGW
ncbi:MFS transporter [Gephyromycinifex aptenodytis]|uniref:MFS transporter n=1 Tax=Gephyromycinifex aptenodytis TaxID=2716227 RepID=UPI001445343C|nr:MFS transporter [Gephyromycinifex aptenodytis]